MNKIKLSTIALINLVLMLSMAALTTIPVRAQQDVELNTYLKLNVAPNPVGQGQTVTVNVFFSKPTPSAGVKGVGTLEAGEVYENITVKIERPDGTKDTIELSRTDQTGGTWFPYTADQVGEYTFQASYPGQTLVSPGYEGIYMKPSVSEKVTLVVQEDPVEWNYATPALPEDYWSRPIYATNWNWWEIGGNWFGLASPAFADTGGYDASGNFQPYSKAPDTPHIIWTKPTHFGGQPGGPIPGDQTSQYSSTSIVQRYFEPIILNGIIYYVQYASTTSEPAGWKAVNLRTGETVWTKETDDLLVGGQILKFHSMQEYGSVAFLYSAPGEPWIYFGQPLEYIGLIDPMTGEQLATITDTEVLGGFLSRLSIPFLIDTEGSEPGTILGHYITGGNLTMWNSTRLLYYPQGVKVRDLQPSGNISFTNGIEWSVPIPTELNGISINLQIAARTLDVILLRSAPTITRFNSAGYQITAGYDTRTGQKLWGPINQTLRVGGDFSVVAAGEGVYVVHDKDTNEAYGFSLLTGEKLWGPVKLVGNAWSALQRAAEIAYGKVYIWDFGGYVNAINLQTGEVEWTFHRGSAGLDTPYGIYPLWYNDVIADGKIYLQEGHMYDPPLHPAKTLCLNATTGELIWSILSFSGRMPPAVADGYMVIWNSYDSQIYTFGKGPTKTTVMAPLTSVSWGSSVVVRGRVTDESPGTKDPDRMARFPNGVPVVADEHQEAWMEYVYMQQPCPKDAEGVEVVLTTFDPNGNTYEIGRTTTDISGTYGIAFEPPVPGLYKITATFEGSKAYYSSFDVTYIYVEEAPAAAAPMEPEQTTKIEQPTQPEQPEAPTAPEQPEAPAEPEAPEQPEDPEVPAAPEQAAEAPLITTELAVAIAVVVACSVGAVSYWKLKKRG